ncbi:TonB-dependent receptor domain-containing protein [Fibrella forsythiae]|uniref:TonB-dependent receptor n=1 Tax=Fibrella forsythiae TaxID=2817061 RepID=A0ABS3JPJ1_9BACT|nr:TonB-dependent receptor [Fibrella forsythiae]MBO0951403.1 TonB-dependent receptor [Fibrella forsythiae]
MRLVILLSVLYWYSSTLANAQQAIRGSISGQCIDQADKPLPFSTMLLVKASDSTLVKGAVADAEGTYLFDHIAAGQYLVAAQQVGYAKNYTAAFSLDADHLTIKLPVLKLAEEQRKLAEVTVVAKRPFIEQQVDRMVVNVENSAVAAGNTLLEVLEKAPGVTVDQQNEELKVRGKSGVIVEIDGKRSYLSTQELMNLLRNTPSDNVEKLEVITNPSAKYDAAGNSGIINIKFKKNKNFGTNGTFTIGAGQTLQPNGRGRASTSLNLNHREGKVNLFGTYSFGQYNNFNRNDIYRRIPYQGNVTYFDQHSSRFSSSQNHNFKLGTDWSMSKKTTIGLLFSGFSEAWNQPNSQSNTDILNEQLTVTRRFSTNGVTGNNLTNLNYNLNAKHQFDDKGRELSADVDYVTYDGRSRNTLGTQYFSPDGSATGRPDSVRNTMPSSINILVAKLDYAHPLGTGKFEAGLKSSRVQSDNDLTFETKSDVWAVDQTRSNRFIYTENISAAYANYSTKLGKKTQLQTGLRLEHTQSVGNSVTLNDLRERTYTNLFPSVFLTQQLDTNNALSLNYSRRIDRPNYQTLNPFIFFLDPYTYQQGNPNLRPQFTHSLQLTHTFKQVFITTLAYSRISDAIISEVPHQIPAENKTYVTSENIDHQDNINLTISFPVKVTKWWQMQTNLSGFYNNYKTYYNDQLLTLQQTSWNVYSSQNLTLSKTMSVEVSGYYNGAGVYGFYRYQPQSALSIGIQKQVWEKKGRFSLNINDIFWGNKFSGLAKFQDIDFAIKSFWQSRVVRASFTYRFGNQNVKAARQRNTGADDLKNRMQSGS